MLLPPLTSAGFQRAKLPMGEQYEHAHHRSEEDPCQHKAVQGAQPLPLEMCTRMRSCCSQLVLPHIPAVGKRQIKYIPLTFYTNFFLHYT